MIENEGRDLGPSWVAGGTPKIIQNLETDKRKRFENRYLEKRDYIHYKCDYQTFFEQIMILW